VLQHNYHTYPKSAQYFFKVVSLA